MFSAYIAAIKTNQPTPDTLYVEQVIKFLSEYAKMFGLSKKYLKGDIRYLKETIPEITPTKILKNFPLIFTIPSETISARVGLQETFKFLQAIQPTIAKSVTALVYKRFSELFNL